MIITEHISITKLVLSADLSTLFIATSNKSVNANILAYRYACDEE